MAHLSEEDVRDRDEGLLGVDVDALAHPERHQDASIVSILISIVLAGLFLW